MLRPKILRILRSRGFEFVSNRPVLVFSSDISPLKRMKLLMLKQVVGAVIDQLFINFIFYRQPDNSEPLRGTVVPQNTMTNESSRNSGVVTERHVTVVSQNTMTNESSRNCGVVTERHGTVVPQNTMTNESSRNFSVVTERDVVGKLQLYT